LDTKLQKIINIISYYLGCVLRKDWIKIDNRRRRKRCRRNRI